MDEKNLPTTPGSYTDISFTSAFCCCIGGDNSLVEDDAKSPRGTKQ